MTNRDITHPMPGTCEPNCPMFGVCHCGCGSRPNWAMKTDAGRGYREGMPYTFIWGHTSRARHHATGAAARLAAREGISVREAQRRLKKELAGEAAASAGTGQRTRTRGDMGWVERAECADLIDCDKALSAHRATEMFFGGDTQWGSWPRAREAVAMCLVCPVWRECLTWASESTDSWRYGIYGGLMPRERHRASGAPDLDAALVLAASRRKKAVA